MGVGFIWRKDILVFKNVGKEKKLVVIVNF